ncbi:MAG: PBP1A family penicillin-binding protein [Chloroflexota bacterium]|nr:MAG: PBP1A family penicillin-binding protein [Chloroflexota bacterium]
MANPPNPSPPAPLPKTREGRKPQRWLLIPVALLGIGILALAIFLFGDLPASDALLTRTSPDTTKILDRNGKLLYEILDPRAGRRTRVALNEMPAHFKNAVVAVEDANYYKHPGVDAVGVARAVMQYAQQGQIVSGGSTITQQLARLVLLSRQEQESRTMARKLREMVLALRLTQTYSKEQILEMYLNEVYFGNLAYGAEAASRAYFGKPARDLDLAESALLAGMIQSPYAYDPYVNPDAARARQRIVLDLMAKNNFITANDADLAANEDLHFKATDKREIIRAPHFVAYVRNLLEQRYGEEAVNAGGLTVTTTLDLNLQERAEEIVSRHIADLKNRTRNENAPDYNLNDAALVAIEPATGEIIAMVGSADYFDESIDGAVNVALSLRQPGSSIKPLTYATAFAQDYTPATVLTDVPTTFQTKENEPYAPQNFDRQWHGPLALRTALATSSNMLAVKVLDHVGLDALIATAKALGITTFDDPDRFGLALTLGGGEVKLVELTAAYAAFANEGRRVEPRAILFVSGLQIADSRWQGDAAISHQPSAISPQIAYLITSILSDDIARIPAFGEDSVLNLSRPAAAKTGTTTDFRDNWTIGYTPDLAVGVWAGNANNAPMYRVSGITGAGPIWHDFMEEALRGIPEKKFARPDGIVEMEICDASGLLPTADCARVRREVFIKGTEPKRTDDAYQKFELDAATNLLWTDGCRGPKISRVFRVYPPDALDWAKKKSLTLAPEMDCMGRGTGDGGRGIGDESNQPSVISHQSLEIVSPANNSIFEMSPQIPAELQKIEVSARLNQAVRLSRVTLLIDGNAIGNFSSVPYRALWKLSAGTHTAQAIGTMADGTRVESDVVRFRVIE